MNSNGGQSSTVVVEYWRSDNIDIGILGLIVSLISLAASLLSLGASCKAISLSRKWSKDTDSLIKELKASVKNLSEIVKCKNGYSPRIEDDDIKGAIVEAKAECAATSSGEAKPSIFSKD